MTVLGGRTTGGPVSRRWPVSVGAVTTTSSDGLSSPPSADHTSAKARSSGGGQPDRERDGQVEVRQRRGEQLARDRVVPQEAGEQCREQPVLVLGTLGPGGDQVRQLEVPGRQVPADDPAAAVVLVLHTAGAAPHVLADVVEVDVHGGRVAPPGPLLGRGVEDHLDVAVRKRLGPDQRPQRLVDLLDHLPRSHPRPSQIRASHRAQRRVTRWRATGGAARAARSGSGHRARARALGAAIRSE